MTANYKFGRFELRPDTRQLLVDDQPAPVGARAFDILQALIERRERLVTKEELLDLAWPGLVVEENNLQVQVSTLRKILGTDAIATVAGKGYRFTLQVGALSHPIQSLEERPVAQLADKPSIAVLPFVNTSDDAANEYFADGLAEELINVLSKVRGLRVASRTSAFSFKGAKVDIPTMAQKLNVATILEGSVRKAGNRVRISAQLIHVATDSHLWSATYDRQLEDIFAVQDDIAQSVVKELRAALMDERPDAAASAAVRSEIQAAARGRGENAEAYRLYLQANFHGDRMTAEDLAIAIETYRAAVKLDPGYALAWAGLSIAYANGTGQGWLGIGLVMRYAIGVPDLWARSAAELVAVARSLRCQVPMVPAAADPPPRPRERARAGGEADSEYSRWLGTENYHDARTGQNYWVSPSRDWSENGPQGAGYYIRNGNDTIKLESGYTR